MRKLISRAAAGALFTTIAMSFTPAVAVNAHSVTDQQRGEHCAVEVYPVDLKRAAAAPVCFGTTGDMAEYLDGLGVNATSARGVAASTVVGTVYKDYNGSGASLTFWGTSGCSGVTFGFSALASGWNNSISSARGSNGCWVTLYAAPNYGGNRLNCTPYCASIGSWNDSVKSLVFRPAGTFG